MNRTGRIALAGLVATGLTVALSGCDQNMVQGPAAIQRNGTHLVVAVCHDIEIGSVLIETWATGVGTPTETVLDASGKLYLEAGSELSPDGSLDGLTIEVRSQPPLNPHDNLAIQILSTDPNGVDINATFTLGNDGLSERLWLRPDGSETTMPCA